VEEPERPYAEMVRTGPYSPAIGVCALTLVEPDPGQELSYNRWYEDDHYPTSMASPWVMAGRRWMAPKRLDPLRAPDDSPIARPIEAGRFLGTYLFMDGRFEEFLEFTDALLERLRADGRIHPGKRHVYTMFHRYEGASYRDERGPRDVHALDYPFAGLVVEVIDAAPAVGRDGLLRWLREERAPAALRGSPAMMCLYLTPFVPEGADFLTEDEAAAQRVVCLWMVERDPAELWDGAFADRGRGVETAGIGRVRFLAPFVPTLPGTDPPLDELR
jgi:hypothetical protein